MKPTDAPAGARAATGAEAIHVLLFLGLLLAAQLAASWSFYLFARNFWVDELYTYTNVADPDVLHALRALAGGAENSPPTYHLFLRAFTLLTGGANEVTLRSFALLSVLVALLGVYVLVRRVYPALVAFTATLAVWSHPLILRHAFEARFYGPWLAALVWFCYFLSRSRDPEKSYVRNVMLAFSAMLVCTMHYFGIITFGLVMCGELLCRRSANAFPRPRLALASLGPVALLACVPLLLSQRAAYQTIPTWVSDPTLADVYYFCSSLLLPTHLAAVLMSAWLSELWRRIYGRTETLVDPPPDTTALAGLTSLVLLSLLLVAFSYTVQSVLIDRYALPAVAALAPAAAFVVSRMSRFWMMILCTFLFLNGAYDLRVLYTRAWAHDQSSAELMTAIREHTAQEPVLFESPHELYVVCRYAPDLAKRCFALDFEEGQLGQVDTLRLFLRDTCRNYGRFYPQPALRSWDMTRTSPRVYLVPQGSLHQRGFPDAEERYPGFTARPVAKGLYELIGDPRKP